MKILDETSLPPKEAFYSKLTGESITDEDYQHAHTVWKEFNIESMKDYHNLYILLIFLKTLGHLHESLWVGSGLVFQCAMSCLGCYLKIFKGSTRIIKRFWHLVIDWKWHQRLIATISHRHAKDNNEYMGAEFDPTKKSKFISYLDANNHYVWAMSKNFQRLGLNG